MLEWGIKSTQNNNKLEDKMRGENAKNRQTFRTHRVNKVKRSGRGRVLPARLFSFNEETFPHTNERERERQRDRKRDEEKEAQLASDALLNNIHLTYRFTLVHKLVAERPLPLGCDAKRNN